jgi:hypothetical protein
MAATKIPTEATLFMECINYASFILNQAQERLQLRYRQKKLYSWSASTMPPLFAMRPGNGYN